MIGLAPTDLIGDIDTIIEDTGYIYQEDALGNKYSAFCVYLGEQQYGIIFNTDHYWNEQFRRFTIAHELGHINMPHHAAILQREKKHQSRPEFQSDDPLEREADLFAINFLAPREAFEEQTQYKDFNKETVSDLANTFNISILATCFRFIELTDLACSLVVSSSSGKIKYDKRSREFDDFIRHEYLNGYSISNQTQTFEMVNTSGSQNFDDCEILLNEWYPKLYQEIPCAESVMRLGYNDSYITMLSILDYKE